MLWVIFYPQNRFHAFIIDYTFVFVGAVFVALTSELGIAT